MNKRELIDKIASEKDDRILVSHLLDLDFRAYEKGIVLAGDFLDLNRASVLSDAQKHFSCYLNFFGGYDDAERKVIYFVPEGVEPEYSDLCVLTSSISAPLGHREVLGSLMSLGIDRKLVGDILISDRKVQIVAKKEISGFIVQNFLRAGRVKLSFEAGSVEDLESPQKNVKEITGTIKTLRLDSIVALAFGVSRSSAKEFINASKVFVNDKNILKSDFVVKEGDKLTLRGKGKAFLKEVGDLSRKERIFVTIEKYI